MNALEFARSGQRSLQLQSDDGDGYYGPKATEEELRMAQELIASIQAAISLTKKIEG